MMAMAEEYQERYHEWLKRMFREERENNEK